MDNLGELALEFGCKVGAFPSSYYGLPLGDLFKSMVTWDEVEERFRKGLIMSVRLRLKEGGLGVIFLSKLNKSLLCKFNWHFAKERGALWKQVINGKYEEEEGGNGRKVRFWKDKWCEEESLCITFPSLFALAISKSSRSGNWIAFTPRRELFIFCWELNLEPPTPPPRAMPLGPSLKGMGLFLKENAGVVVLPQVKVKDTEDVTEDSVTNTLRRAINFHSTLQAHDGHWPGDYGGPMFLLPGLIITLSITGALNAVLSKEHRQEMCRYLYNHQNKDGGWGLHIEGPSTMFGTVLNYVTLRLLGEGANDADGAMEKGRDWILNHGGATAITSWGKMWLSVLGVFEWSGNNPLPPEIWLLPYILPVHPDWTSPILHSKLLVHTI
ncbi:Cycloartenol Synthase [Vitis vinifera]|uniref:Cycloartenol Synthase n=1 Tax=Vitis vinifera TaxID=29760 RepID=A0A438GA93_VITVI|nr:Cycloartenol Synthase [Vitis vinifera]